jgi:hypothetical protein
MVVIIVGRLVGIMVAIVRGVSAAIVMGIGAMGVMPGGIPTVEGGYAPGVEVIGGSPGVAAVRTVVEPGVIPSVVSFIVIGVTEIEFYVIGFYEGDFFGGVIADNAFAVRSGFLLLLFD